MHRNALEAALALAAALAAAGPSWSEKSGLFNFLKFLGCSELEAALALKAVRSLEANPRAETKIYFGQWADTC